MRLLPAVLCLAALPAAAEPALPDAASPVRALVLGHALFHQGQATRDGLAQIAGARIVAGVVVQIVERDSKIEGKASKEAAAARAPLDGTQMMTEAAAAVQADETLAYLLTVSETTTAVLPKATVKATAAQLAAGQSQTFRLAADGGARLDLGVIGAGPGGLALVARAGEAVLCQSAGLPLCEVVLPDSGFVDVTVRNAGAQTENYLFVSN